MRSYAEGRKTITTHLAAAIAAYTGGKETLTPPRQPAAQTDAYGPERRQDAHTSADGMSVIVDTGKRITKRGTFTTKTLSCGMLLSARTWVSWLHLQLDNNAEPFKASLRSDSVAWLFPRAALITRPLAHTRSRRVIIWRRLRRELPAQLAVGTASALLVFTLGCHCDRRSGPEVLIAAGIPSIVPLQACRKSGSVSLNCRRRGFVE